MEFQIWNQFALFQVATLLDVFWFTGVREAWNSRHLHWMSNPSGQSSIFNFLCRLWSIAAHGITLSGVCLSVRLSVCASVW